MWKLVADGVIPKPYQFSKYLYVAPVADAIASIDALSPHLLSSYFDLLSVLAVEIRVDWIELQKK